MNEEMKGGREGEREGWRKDGWKEDERGKMKEER